MKKDRSTTVFETEAPPPEPCDLAMRQIDDFLARERAVREEIPAALTEKGQRLLALADGELAVRGPLVKQHKPFVDTVVVRLQDPEFRQVTLAARQDPARLDRLADEAVRYLVDQPAQLQRGQKNVQAALADGATNRLDPLELGRLEIESVGAGNPQVGAAHLLDTVQLLQAALTEIVAFVAAHGAPPAGQPLEIPPDLQPAPAGSRDAITEFDVFDFHKEN